MRYRRQTHDLLVSVPDGEVTAATARALVESFEQSYEAVYGKGAGFFVSPGSNSPLSVSSLRRPHSEAFDP